MCIGECNAQTEMEWRKGKWVGKGGSEGRGIDGRDGGKNGGKEGLREGRSGGREGEGWEKGEDDMGERLLIACIKLEQSNKLTISFIFIIKSFRLWFLKIHISSQIYVQKKGANRIFHAAYFWLLM